MSSPKERIAARSKRLTFLVGLMAIVLLCGASIRLLRPKILVGRNWSASETVACSDVSHQLWDELLQRFVDTQGNVDYRAWKQSVDDQNRLNDYLNSLSRMDERRFASRKQRLAFWINAYNALTVHGILREYPTNSIQSHVGRAWGYNIWRDLRLMVGDKSYSLGEIEHSILRPLAEPRIHFAIVCASRGCPRLRNEAYTAERLEEQLQGDALTFFAEPSKCTVDSAKNELYLSPILKWYATDFGASTSDVLQRIANWLPKEARAVAQARNTRVVYLDYDWSLNDTSTVAPPLPPFE